MFEFFVCFMHACRSIAFRLGFYGNGRYMIQIVLLETPYYPY